MNIFDFLIIHFIVFKNVLGTTWNLGGTSGNGYYIQAKIGSPPQHFNLLLDTGSSNTAIAGDFYPGIESHYLPKNSSTYVHDGTLVEISYYQGKLAGYLGKDIVVIPKTAFSLPMMTDLAIITAAEDFYVNNSHWQGILGLAFKQIAKPTGLVTPWYDALSNVTENEFPSFSLELCGPDPKSHVGTHKGKFTLNSRYDYSNGAVATPLVTERFYEVSISQIRVGYKILELPCLDFNNPRTIIDSGTTNIQLASNTFYHLIAMMRKHVEMATVVFTDGFWYDREKICFNSADKIRDLFPDLSVYLNHDDESHFGFVIPPRSYIRIVPASSNSSHSCYQLGIEQSHGGTVLGAVFLEGLIVTFDRLKKLVHFSASKCGPHVVLLPPESKTDKRSCVFSASSARGTLIASSIIVVVILVPLMYACAKWIHKHVRHQRTTGSVPFVSLSDTAT